MYIESIKLQNFRNYPALDLDFHPNVNIILGDNAQGKTNLLEAVYVTSLGKSFRTYRDSEMIRFGEDMARVCIRYVKGGSPSETELIINPRSKAVKVNGVKIRKTADLVDNMYQVIFSPEDLRIVKDGPEKRRGFIDRELCQIRTSYFSDVMRYNKVLKQRNAYLKEDVINADALSVWDENLAAYGNRIIKARAGFIEKINAISGAIQAEITGGREALDVRYEPDVSPDEDMLCAVRAAGKADIYGRTTSRGPHRDDVAIFVDGNDIRRYGSQGQQRTAALALKLAEIRLIKEETGEDAVLLLDDVLSELDAERQNYLINTFGNIQLFITAADISPDVMSRLPEGKTIHIKDGGAY